MFAAQRKTGLIDVNIRYCGKAVVFSTTTSSDELNGFC